MQPLDVALAHKASREALTHKATSKALRLWSQVPLANLDAGWDAIAPQLLAVGVAAQSQAVTQATSYVAKVSDFYGGSPDVSLVAEAFTGITLDGRELVPAAYGAVTATKTLIGRGVSEQQAFIAGASFLSTVFGAAIQDMGRMADLSLAGSKKWTRYYRVISATACSRCAILAGKRSGAVAFKRHPRCKCGVWPVEGKTPEGMYDSPFDFFESLSREQQDKTFTKAGAEAIRNGADPIKVVNARRGAYGIGYSGGANAPAVNLNRLVPLDIGVKADGSRLRVYATTEGTTNRGAYGRRTSMVRLMPEQLMRQAGNDPVRWRELLTKYGYVN